jgi:competence ComEA-like helix-hairpin-helix protein
MRGIVPGKLRERLSGIRQSIVAAGSQFYTPREFRALALFLGVGIAVLLFRFGKQAYFTWLPEKRDSREILDRRRADSLFFALSAEANRHDSLFFSLPEDSLLPVAVRQAKAKPHSKTDGLALHSISLNLGTKEDLIRLPSVGPASAEEILAYRNERGNFRTLEELMNVRGIGEIRYNKMKRYLKLN